MTHRIQSIDLRYILAGSILLFNVRTFYISLDLPPGSLSMAFSAFEFIHCPQKEFSHKHVRMLAAFQQNESSLMTPLMSMHVFLFHPLHVCLCESQLL